MSLKPIDNCSLKDILNLFEIEEITMDELKKAKRKVLLLHPDKNIGKDTSHYYEYFRSGYYKLEEIYNFINTNKNQSTEYTSASTSDVTTETQKAFYNYYLKNGLDKNKEKFSKTFNEAFDKVYVKDDNGYGDWLKTNEGIFDNKNIEESRKNAMQLIKKDKNDIQSFSEVDNYSDLKDAHINSVFTIDAEETYKKKEKFNTIEEYQRHRSLDTRNLNLANKKEEHERILSQQQKEEKMNSMNLAYEFMKETERNNNIFNKYCSKFLSITK
jgi:hypothetical protein